MKKDILFIHGNSLSTESFVHQLNDSSLTQYFTLHTIDLPGHGVADRNLSNYGLSGFISSIIRFIEQSKMRRISIVGHSLGGHLAINLLALDKKFEIEKMMLVGTPPLRKPFDPNAFLPNPMMATAFGAELSESQASQLAKALGSEDFVRSIMGTDPAARASIGVDIEAGKTYDEVELVKQFGSPSNFAIVLGKNDPLINSGYINNLNLTCWRNEIIQIPECGHSPQYEKPEVFNSFLKDFLS